MSETASFVDPVYLARFGLFRANVLNYFLHPLNPFRTPANTSNEYLEMQQVTIGLLMQIGIPNANSGGMCVPLPPKAAEEEYARALSRLTGEQYELMPPVDPLHYTQPSPLYTIRHVLRTNPTSVKILGKCFPLLLLLLLFVFFIPHVLVALLSSLCIVSYPEMMTYITNHVPIFLTSLLVLCLFVPYYY